MLIFYMSLIDNEEDKNKFEIIYNEYRERMYFAAYEVLKNNEDAEDAVHNAFIGIANNMKSVDDPYSSRTLSYVIKAAKNMAINMYNKDKKIMTVELKEEMITQDDDFIKQLNIKEKYNAVIKAIEELDEIYRIPMYYYYICNMKYREIAELIGIKTTTVSQRIYRGRKKLLAILDEDDYDR